MAKRHLLRTECTLDRSSYARSAECARVAVSRFAGRCVALPDARARRMEVYAAVYDRALNVKRAIAADIVDENSYKGF